MFRLAPIDSDFVPYSRRPVRKNNAGLFVKGRRRGGGAPPAVALQSSMQCRYPCDSLNCPPGMVCDQTGGTCVPRFEAPGCP
jgi:hypothetical protein